MSWHLTEVLNAAFQTGMQIAGLKYADDIAFIITSAAGQQALINLVSTSCAMMGTVVSVPRTKVVMLILAFPDALQRTCEGQQLELDSEI